MSTALGIALEHHWPFIAHIEFASLGDAPRTRFIRGFETLLDANLELLVALIHMGQVLPTEVRRLIEAPPNAPVLTTHTNTGAVAAAEGANPWIDMFDGKRLRLATVGARSPTALRVRDGQRMGAEQPGLYNAQIALWRNALAPHTGAVAATIAHGNAERLWRLPQVGLTRRS